MLYRREEIQCAESEQNPGRGWGAGDEGRAPDDSGASMEGGSPENLRRDCFKKIPLILY